MLDGSQATTLGSLIVAWAAVFFVLRRLLFPRFTATFSNVVVSYIHACVAMGLAVQLSAVDWRHPFSGYGQPPTPAQMTVLSVRLSTGWSLCMRHAACAASLVLASKSDLRGRTPCDGTQPGLFHLRCNLLRAHQA